MNEKNLNDESKIVVNSSSNNALITILILLIVLLLVGGFFAYKYYTKKENTTPNEQKEKTYTRFGFEELVSVDSEAFSKISIGEVTADDFDSGTSQKVFFDDICEKDKNCQTTVELSISGQKHTIRVNIDREIEAANLMINDETILEIYDSELCVGGTKSYMDVIDNKYLVVSTCSVGGFGGNVVSILNSNFTTVISGESDEVESPTINASFKYDGNKIYYWVYTYYDYGEENRGAVKFQATIKNDKLINIIPIKRIKGNFGEE